MKWFYLDDERKVPKDFDAILITNFDSMIRMIDTCVEYHIPFGIDFDHDIGDEYYSGYTVAKYIVENQISMDAFHLHTANPVGRDNIRQLLTHYGYTEIK